MLEGFDADVVEKSLKTSDCHPKQLIRYFIDKTKKKNHNQTCYHLCFSNREPLVLEMALTTSFLALPSSRLPQRNLSQLKTSWTRASKVNWEVAE